MDRLTARLFTLYTPLFGLILVFALIKPWSETESLFWIVGSFLCHQYPQRSFFLYHKQIFVCARCSGLYIGILIGSASLIISKRLTNKIFPQQFIVMQRRIRYLIIVGMLTVIEFVIFYWFLPGFLESFKIRNLSRLVTGIVSGFAYGCFAALIILASNRFLSWPSMLKIKMTFLFIILTYFLLSLEAIIDLGFGAIYWVTSLTIMLGYLVELCLCLFGIVLIVRTNENTSSYRRKKYVFVFLLLTSLIVGGTQGLMILAAIIGYIVSRESYLKTKDQEN